MDQATGGAAASTPATSAAPSSQQMAPAGPDLHSTPVSADAARSALETLRSQRLAGQVGEHAYLERADYLARFAAGENAAAPPDPHAITQEQKLQQQYDVQMTAPKELGQYGRLPPMSNDSAQAQEIDTAVRTAFVKAGIPAHLGPALVDAVNHISNKVSPTDERGIQTHLQSTANALRTQWGDQFDTRFAAITDLVCELGEGDPAVGEILDQAPWLIFASEAAMDYLGRIVDHRSKAR